MRRAENKALKQQQHPRRKSIIVNLFIGVGGAQEEGKKRYHMASPE